MAGNDQWMQGDPEKSRIHREKEYYKQEMLKLDNDLEYELHGSRISTIPVSY